MPIQIAKNSPWAERAAEDIGRLVVNFGFAEALSYSWISVLSTDSIVTDLSVDLQLRARIDLIEKLIARSARPDEWKKKSTELWETMGRLSETRNVVCHNPIVFAWKDSAESFAPDLLWSPRLKKILRNKTDTEGITPETIAAAVNKTASVVKDLFKALAQISPSNPAADTVP